MGTLKDDFLLIYGGMGFCNACRLILLPRICQRLGLKYNTNRAFNWFIDTNFKDVILQYTEIDLSKSISEIPNIIWIFWWQGKLSMPQVIRQCYLSVLRNANGRKVIFIDESNYSEYVELPDYLYDKFKKKKISFTHFSDVIRVELLRKYGGLWIDAAIFVTRPIPYCNGCFFSPRICLMPQDSPHMHQWVMGVMGASPNMPLFNYMHDMLNTFWNKYDVVFHYLMFDYFLRYGYEHFGWVKELMDNRSINSPDIHSTRYTFNQEVNEALLDKLLERNTFLSLTYRIPYHLKLENGKMTYYYALLKKYNINYGEENGKKCNGGGNFNSRFAA